MKLSFTKSLLMLVTPTIVWAQALPYGYTKEPKVKPKQEEIKQPLLKIKKDKINFKDLTNNSQDKPIELNDEMLKSAGTNSGGGGNASEIEVDEIRSDILKWIGNGGPSAFKEFPKDVNLNSYIDRMARILQPHTVVIGFVNSQQESETSDPELKVIVDGQPKQCRGFISTKDKRPHILCNSDRYPKEEADQYRLVHHEYAGLVQVEKNVGASSDYVFSNQLTSFLENRIVKRLAIKPQQTSSIDEQLLMKYLPTGTMINLPINYNLLPTQDRISLPGLKLDEKNILVCELRIYPLSEVRTYSGLLSLKSVNSPDYLVGGYITGISDSVLNGAALGIWNVINAVECWKYSKSEDKYFEFNLEEFRRYIESLGGNLRYPAPRKL